MLAWIRCWFNGHRPIRKVESDAFVYEKGEGRGIAAFSGTMLICACGREQFDGDVQPWFIGTPEEWALQQRHMDQLKKDLLA